MKKKYQSSRQYAPSVKEILAEAGIKYTPNTKRKKKRRRNPYAKKKLVISDRLKKAFIPIDLLPSPLSANRIVVNPNKPIMRCFANRRWRYFWLSENYIAICERCGRRITEGYVSRNDYICSVCRNNTSMTKSNIWTVKKR